MKDVFHHEWVLRIAANTSLFTSSAQHFEELKILHADLLSVSCEVSWWQEREKRVGIYCLDTIWSKCSFAKMYSQYVTSVCVMSVSDIENAKTVQNWNQRIKTRHALS